MVSFLVFPFLFSMLKHFSRLPFSQQVLSCFVSSSLSKTKSKVSFGKEPGISHQGKWPIVPHFDIQLIAQRKSSVANRNVAPPKCATSSEASLSCPACGQPAPAIPSVPCQAWVYCAGSHVAWQSLPVLLSLGWESNPFLDDGECVLCWLCSLWNSGGERPNHF